VGYESLSSHGVSMVFNGENKVDGDQGLRLQPVTIADLGHLSEELTGASHHLWSHVLLCTARARWLQPLVPNRPPLPVVLSLRQDGVIQGLVMAVAKNISGSCWSLHQLCLGKGLFQGSRRTVALALVRHAIAAVPQARCWFARCRSTDSLRLPLLREAGFQPLLSQSIWHLHPATTKGWPRTGRGPVHYGRLRWERSRAPALLQLENAITPIQLRQLLERSSHDLCRLTMGGVLLESSSGELGGALRFIRPHPVLPPQLEVAVHPGHVHLYGKSLQGELARLLDLAPRFGVRMEGNVWQLRCNQGEEQRQRWFTDLGLEHQGDDLLLARSIWRRQVSPMGNRWRHWLVDARQQLTPGRRPIPDLSQLDLPC